MPGGRNALKIVTDLLSMKLHNCEQGNYRLESIVLVPGANRAKHFITSLMLSATQTPFHYYMLSY